MLSCQQDTQPLLVKLDKVIYNSYHQTLRGRNTMELAEDETVLYDKGRLKVSTRSADVEFQDTKFRVSLVDANQDGFFNTAGTDMVILSVYGQDTVALDPREAHVGLLRQRTFIQVDRRFFLVDAPDEAGEELMLIPWERPPSDALAAVGKTYLAKFSVRNTDGKESYLSWTKGDRPRLLLFWNFSDQGEKLLEAANRLKPAWEQRLELITFCMNDDPDLLQQAEVSDFPVYLITSKSCKTINCHAHLPFAMLIDEKGQILQSELKSAAVLDILAGNAVISAR